ncbi:DUF4383 domain-containing protein [Actinoplanes sp. NPDC051859]|uniref:DUF4383 domain-containing protein n=1 Tax=Actinoplanes sp. NPDC051859 TaxID=3363909 RepID=UPI0037AE73DA
MAHIPVNHPLRPIYRALGALTGVYLILFGIVGIIVTSGDGMFGNGGDRVLGQHANLFWSICSLLIGAIVVLSVVIGRNSDVEVAKYFGWGLLVVGSYALAVIRTDANFLDFSVSTVVVTYLVGTVLIMVSLYCKVAPAAQTGEPRQVRQAKATQNA